MVPTERSRICRYCGLEAPRAHWSPFAWTEKHEEICPKNPSKSRDTGDRLNVSFVGRKSIDRSKQLKIRNTDVQVING